MKAVEFRLPPATFGSVVYGIAPTVGRIKSIEKYRLENRIMRTLTRKVKGPIDKNNLNSLSLAYTYSVYHYDGELFS